MELLTGLAPTKIELPEGKGWVKVRRMTLRERNQHRHLLASDQNALADEHLLKCSVVDFLLPSQADPVRANAEDAEARMAQLDTADDGLEDWLMEQVCEVNGHTLRARLLRMARDGVALTEEIVRQVETEEREEREAELGNSGGSPTDSTVDASPSLEAP